MGCTVKELLARVDSKELSEWQAYYAINPFGQRRADMRMARLCTIMANAWRGKGPSINEDDFMFKFGEKEQKEIDETTVKAMLGIPL